MIVLLSLCLELFMQTLILLPQLQVDVNLRGKHFLQILSTKLVSPLRLLALVAVNQHLEVVILHLKLVDIFVELTHCRLLLQMNFLYSTL